MNVCLSERMNAAESPILELKRTAIVLLGSPSMGPLAPSEGGGVNLRNET